MRARHNRREALRRRLCPRCGSARVLPVVYGMPGPELIEEAEAGKVVLGGCVVSGEDPRWECGDCGEQWGKQTPE